MKQKNSGITLIALVVTIIVLLILAGVSLSLVAGGNGVINKASKAVDKTNEASAREEVELALAEWTADYYAEDVEMEGRTGTTGSGASVIYSNGQVVYAKKSKTYVMSLNSSGSVDEITEPEKSSQLYKSTHPEEHIPTGFEYKEGNVGTGYVIKDNDGNEFVWIPVANSSAYAKKLGKNNWRMVSGSSGTDLGANYTVSEMVQGDTLGVSSILGTRVASTLDANQPEAEIVNNAGGFWVGRYEAGTTSTADASTIDWATEEIVVQQGMQPARNIAQATALSRANTWDSGEADSSKGTVAFQSGLITGTQWDVMCNFIGWDVCDSNCSSWGNYFNTASASYTGYHSSDGSNDWISETGITKNALSNKWIFPTGKFISEANVNTMKKNIYDVAGNALEWTTEIPVLSANNSVTRGGCNMNSGDYMRASSRGGSLVFSGYYDCDVGFRLVLYVQ